MSIITQLLLSFITSTIFILDIITLPIYFIIYRPWKKVRSFNQTRARRIATGLGEVTYLGNDRPSAVRDEILNHRPQIRTLDKVFEYVFEKHPEWKSLGTREIIREETEIGPDGKPANKLVMGNYSWLTYAKINHRAEACGKGLRSLGLQQRENIAIYADTRADWLMAAIGCFKFNIPLVTIYTNLGESGVLYAIKQSKAEYVLVSQELYQRLQNILMDLPDVKTIIVFEEPHKGPVRPLPEEFDCKLYTFEEVVQLGYDTEIQITPPLPDDTAIIMYTSGSTGNPKGVILTHCNLLNSLLAFLVFATYSIGKVRPNDAFIAYLPLAHVLELLSEGSLLILGLPIGYSSPYTLTDTSLKIKAGQKGDVSVLRPSIMCAVPVILDRIYKGINKKLDEGGEFKSKLVNFFIKYRSQWVEKGYDTPIVNALIFKKIKAVVGGNVRVLVSGGAPLAPESHQFIRTCLCVNLHQGYGLTETGAVACITDETDLSTGRVGTPLYGVEVKLIDWIEGGYRTTDKNGPRGEIVIGGLHVAKGYYNMPEQTEADFYNENGKRWFKTGDIGQVMSDGTIKIIDRRKDLVKLQMGEYVSLGKVESILKPHEIIDVICVCARPTERATVAFVIPDQAQLELVGKRLNKTALSRSNLCKDPEVTKEVLRMLSAYGTQMKLERFEIPKALTLIEENWAPDSGLVTAALKLKRPALDTFYKNDIDNMYNIINKEFAQK